MEIPSLGLFLNDDPVMSNREINRFELLNYFNNCCKKEKLGVSLDSFCCLCTRNPKYPINFWHYEPQHEQDKAPTKAKNRDLMH